MTTAEPNLRPRPMLPALFCVVLLTLLPGASDAGGEPDPLDRFDTLLARYVTVDGVLYDAWRDNPADARALAEIATALAAGDPARLSPAERNALYINLYNATILDLILAGDPPKSIRDLGKTRMGFGIFRRKMLDFDGQSLSLNALEERLREESQDPRVHFAVNCASRSCPALAARAYRAERLDEQLDRQTRLSLSDPAFLAIDKETNGKGELVVRASKLFDWYSDDFTVAGGPLAFIAEHAPPDVAARIAGQAGKIDLVYLDYDWSLNAADRP